MRKCLKKIAGLSVLLVLAAAALLLSACGESETAEPSAPPAPVETETPESSLRGRIIITELMYRNKGSLCDSAGDFPDWIELFNASQESVPLSGCSLSDRADEEGWIFPECSIEPGEYLVVYCGGDSSLPMHCGFSLSEGEEVYLKDSEGLEVSSVLCIPAEEGYSLSSQDGIEFTPCRWISPGYENTDAGHESYAAARSAAGPLVINEVVVSPLQGSLEDYDWIEIKNISGEELELSSYCLSDDADELSMWTFPQGSLGPGEFVLVSCSDWEVPRDPYRLYTGFSLNSENENLYLSDSEGKLLDFVHLQHIPAGGSMGRMSGREGFFYFGTPSPAEENTDGCRRVSSEPVLLGEDGIFNDAGSVSAQLSAEGKIYYTTDGSLPTAESQPYTSALSFDSTTVLRAVALEEDALPSPPVSFSYIINENHSLPVLSLVTDSPYAFYNMFIYGQRGIELQANLALYGDAAEFNRRCSLCMKGYTSLGLPKKSMGVSFKGSHGGPLEGNLFDNGIEEFSKLSIRAGQDYTFSIIRNELFQELCLEASDKLYTQSSKYCALYVNGQYYGLYCLKEDLNRSFYASHAGVSRDSVECIKFPAAMGSSFWNEVLEFVWNNDMSQEENYNHICSIMDTESLIDWFIFEGYCANSDIQGNLKVFRSPENGGIWQFSFYDLDWGFYDPEGDFATILEFGGNTGYLMPSLICSMLENDDFRARFLERFKELNESILSNEHVLAKIDELQALIDSEVPRERERWDLSYDAWLGRVDELRSYINDYNREIHNIDQICRLLGISDEERQEFFGR